MSSPSIPPQPSVTVHFSSSSESLISYLRRNFFTLESPSSLPHEEPELPNPYLEVDNNSNTSSLTHNDYIDLSYHSSEEESHLFPSYTDFRYYPLTIDWSSIENAENNYYEIYDVFGCFGIATFSMLSEIKNLSFEHNDYIYSVLNYYYKAKYTCSYENIINLFNHLPRLDIIKEILMKGMFSKKEIVIMKIVLDLYEMYVINECFFDCDENNLKLYIETAKLFYCKCISEKDLGYIYDVVSKEMKRSFQLLNKMGCKICKKKKNYDKHINEIKRKYVGIVKGLNKESFIM